MTSRPHRLRFSNQQRAKTVSPIPLEIELTEPLVDPKHLETTARGVEKARKALAEAKQATIEAEAIHNANLLLEIATLKEKLHEARTELYGAQATKAIEDIEAEESVIVSQAELNLEGLGLA